MIGHGVDVIGRRYVAPRLHALAHELAKRSCGIVNIGAMQGIRFGGSNVTVAQHHVFEIKGKRLFNHLRTELDEHAPRVFKNAGNVWAHFNGIFLRRKHRETHALQGLSALGRSLPMKQRMSATCWVKRIGTRHQCGQQRAVLHIARHGSDRIERSRQGQRTMQANQPARGLEARNAV